jgi:uncharacterized protein (DUF58 family)
MRRKFLLGLIIYALIAAGLALRSGELVVLSLPFLMYLLSSLFFIPKEINLQVSRTLSAERVGPDQPVTVTVTVSNFGSPLDEVVIEDDLSPNLIIVDGSPCHILHLPRGKTASWSYTISGRRGYYNFAAVRVSVSDHFGLINRQEFVPTEGQLLILPPVLRLKRVAIRPRRTRVYAGEIPARTGGLGVEFFSVREYQLGDPSGWINWRASARHGSQLFSNEFEQERVADVGIILDGRVRSNILAGHWSLFEYSVQAAATLSNAFLSQGHRVGLLHYGEYIQWTLPGYGKLQQERILRALTQVEPGDSLVFSYLQYIPTRLVPPQSQIVLISPLTRDDPDVLLQIRARGYQVLVISPDPVAFELAKLPKQPLNEQAGRILSMERNMLLQSLLRGGIRAINWDVAQPFDHVVNRLSRTPTRVVF